MDAEGAGAAEIIIAVAIAHDRVVLALTVAALLAGVTFFGGDANPFDFIGSEPVMHKRRAFLDADLFSIQAHLRLAEFETAGSIIDVDEIRRQGNASQRVA